MELVSEWKWTTSTLGKGTLNHFCRLVVETVHLSGETVHPKWEMQMQTAEPIKPDPPKHPSANPQVKGKERSQHSHQ
jgi:hypothetical protein